MRKLLLASCFGVAALFTAGYAAANEELTKMAADPNQWVMPAGNFANTRYSELKQINTENVHKLAPAWTFSTGVLRGHEGAPLVIGDVMFLHAPFPNTVFALDLNNDGKILWKYEPKQDPNVIPVMCCDTVNRGLVLRRRQDLPPSGGHDARRPRRQDRRGRLVGEGRRSVEGRRPAPTRRSSSRTRCSSACRAASSAFAAGSAPTTSRTASSRGAAYSEGPDSDLADRSGKDHGPRQAGRQGFQPQDLARRSVEDRRRRHLGLVFLRSRPQSDVLRLGQSLDLESRSSGPATTSGR